MTTTIVPSNAGVAATPDASAERISPVQASTGDTLPGFPVLGDGSARPASPELTPSAATPTPTVPGADAPRGRPATEDLPVVRLTSPMSADEPGELPLIRMMQNALELPPGERDGIFGPYTQRELRAWQREWNAANPSDPIDVDGVAGPQVWDRLVFPNAPVAVEPAEPVDRPPLEDLPLIRAERPWYADEPGEFPLVTTLQAALDLPASDRDGVFGPVTSARLREWQSGWNSARPDDPISVDGVAGPQVWSRLVFPAEPPATVAEPVPADLSENVVAQLPVAGGAPDVLAEIQAPVTPALQHIEERPTLEHPAPAVIDEPRPASPPTVGALPVFEGPHGGDMQPGDPEWVSELQSRLEVPRTGIFDDTTTEAVREFQDQHNRRNIGRGGFIVIRADGYVDEATWDAIVAARPLDGAAAVSPFDSFQSAEPDGPRPPELAVGTIDSRGQIAWVHELQRRLGVSADGVFGARETGPAVQEFQRAHNASFSGQDGVIPLRTDGVVDSATWDAIVATHPLPRPRYDQSSLRGALPDPYQGDTSLALFEASRAGPSASSIQRIIAAADDQYHAVLESAVASAESDAEAVRALIAASVPRHVRNQLLREAIPVLGGQDFLTLMETEPTDQEELIVQAVLAGNVPDHVRSLVPVTVGRHGMEVTFYTLPDVISIGSNDDYVAIPMNRVSAERIAARLGMMLPTPQMVDDRWDQADYRFVPASLGGAATARISAYREHNAMLQREGTEGSLVGGMAKVYVTDSESELGHIGYYGWMRANGTPIQPSYDAHNRNYADYSHGALLSSLFVHIDGVAYSVHDLLRHPTMHRLISHEWLPNL
ncbi:MAG: peptidoglycan-binding protein [Myxococcota bacterium]